MQLSYYLTFYPSIVSLRASQVIANTDKITTTSMSFYYYSYSLPTPLIKQKYKVEEWKAMEKQSSEKEGCVMVLLQSSMKKLYFGSWEEKEVAANMIEEGLAKKDVKVRELTSKLGVVK